MIQKLMYLYLDISSIEMRDEIQIFGLDNKDFDRFTQASVNDLNYDMYKQKRLLSLELHPDEELCPWNGLLVVEEGICCWDEHEAEYKMIK